MEFKHGDFATITSREMTEIPKLPPIEIASEFIPQKIYEFAKMQHATLNQALDAGVFNIEEIQSYSIYGVLRNPIDRFFSLFSFFITNSLYERKIDVKILSRDEIAAIAFDVLEETERSGKRYCYINSELSINELHPQAHWLIYGEGKIINNIVVYPNFDDMLIKLVGSPQLEFRKKIGIKPVNAEMSKSTLEGIRYWYAEDFDLWEKLGYNK